MTASKSRPPPPPVPVVELVKPVEHLAVPVSIDPGELPLPVVVQNPEALQSKAPPPLAPALPVQSQRTDPSLPARTTFQEDLTTAGQRHVNLIWESTQGKIALYVILGTMVIDGLSVLMSMVLDRDFTAAQALAIGFVNSLSTGVISFYFSRTNHTNVGGIGEKPTAPYVGR